MSINIENLPVSIIINRMRTPSEITELVLNMRQYSVPVDGSKSGASGNVGGYMKDQVGEGGGFMVRMNLHMT